jgi:hypothetical protein
VISALNSYLLFLPVVFCHCQTNSGYKFSDDKILQFTMIYDIEILIAYQFRESLTAFCLALLLFPLRFDSLDGRMAGNKYSPLVVTP